MMVKYKELGNYILPVIYQMYYGHLYFLHNQ